MDRALVDRRPSILINFFSGTYTQSNPEGLATWWRYDRNDTDAVNELVTRCTAALAVGDVLVFNRWTGVVPNVDTIPANFWPAMPAPRQAAIIAIFKPWWLARLAEDPSRRLWGYCCGLIRDDRDTTKLSPGNLTDNHPPIPTDPADATYIHAIWDPLVEIGFTGWMEDYGGSPALQASSRAMYDSLALGDFFAEPLNFAIEAIPVVVGSPDKSLNHMPDASMVYRQPCLARRRYIRSHEHDNQGQRLWTFDGTRSEVSVWVAANEAMQYDPDSNGDGTPDPVATTRADIQSLMRRGCKILAATAESQLWAFGLAAAPEPEDVAFVHAANGNTVTWTAGTAAEDEEGVEIAVSFYEVFRADAVDGPYVKIGGTTGLTYLDVSGTSSHYYKVGSWTEYGCSSLTPQDLGASAAAPGATVGWIFEGTVSVLNTG